MHQDRFLCRVKRPATKIVPVVFRRGIQQTRDRRRVASCADAKHAAATHQKSRRRTRFGARRIAKTKLVCRHRFQRNISRMKKHQMWHPLVTKPKFVVVAHLRHD